MHQIFGVSIIDMTGHTRFSRRERQLMDILYAMGKATTEEIRERMEDAPSSNAVRTLLQILEEKGHLRRTKAGREYTYEPTQSRARVGLRALQHVLETFYEGSIEKALTAHLSRRQEKLKRADFERLKQLIDEARRKEK